MSSLRVSTSEIIIHCSATPSSMDIGVTDIDRWHRAKGWMSIGYHYVIRRDGTLEPGRGVNTVGAHAKGHNGKSVGICLVGGAANDATTPEANFTASQYVTLADLLVELQGFYPDARILGHNEISNKACPSFDVQQWLQEVGLTNAPSDRGVCESCGRPL